MANNYGSGASRVISAAKTQFQNVIFQRGRPPLDAEMTLVSDLAQATFQNKLRAETPSGWVSDSKTTPFVTNRLWSNWFMFGNSVQWAKVNGWLVPVRSTRTGSPPGSPNNTSAANHIWLEPPPPNSGDHRADFVFLEVWLARIPCSPSSLNKPTSSSLYPWGNVEGGESYLADEILDPAIGSETTQRVQLQYRIRTVKGILGLSLYPDGFDPAVVFAQGALTSAPSSGFTFENQGANGDPGLWRAGDGTPNSLGTVDGYSYAIPIACVFRRNTAAWSSDPAPNLNGGFSRNPTAVTRLNVKTFGPDPVLSDNLTATATTISLVSLAGTAFPLYPTSTVYIQIGDEVLSYTGTSGNTLTGVLRGQRGTIGEVHAAGATVSVLSGRPDGLFSDQVTLTDILDLRHVIGNNDYEGLLEKAVNDLLTSRLRAGWKRSSGAAGVFLSYEDKISSTPAALGVSALDAPDHIRSIFSDAACVQPITVLCQPFSGIVNAGSQPVSSSWSLNTLSLTTTRQAAANTWSSDSVDLAIDADPVTGAGDRIVFPVAGTKSGLPGGDSDQVRFLNEIPARGVGTIAGSTLTTSVALGNVSVGDTLAVFFGPAKGTYTVTAINSGTLEFSPSAATSASDTFFEVRKGSGLTLSFEGTVLPQHRFVVSPANPGFADNLTIQFVGAGWPFPVLKTTTPNLAITTHIQYGPGRGLSRRANVINQIALYSPTSELLCQSSTPLSRLRSSWLALDASFRRAPYLNQLPVVAEAYGDPGSKTVKITPWQRVALPSTVGVVDGNACNEYAVPVTTGTSTNLAGSVLTDSTKDFVALGVTSGDLLIIDEGPSRGSYVISTCDATTITLYHDVPSVSDTTVTYKVKHTQGLMPLKKRDGVTSKWSTTDPLGYFSGSTDADVAKKNFAVALPANLFPGWGSVYVPILAANGTTFHRGVNCILQSKEGDYTAVTDSDHNKAYINYTTGVPFSYAAFSTGDLSGATIVDATYNATFAYSGTFAGARFYTDTRNLGREGIQFPPFYGLARVWAVYEAADYKANGPAFSLGSRSPISGGAQNLLRQNFEGPVYWIDTDDDGDSTFILNAEALDLTKAGITDFRSKHYVVTASIFGFDRGSFDGTSQPRLVLSRDRSVVSSGSRATNITSTLPGPVLIVPAPLTAADTALIDYSRTPYQGDPWGTQMGTVDKGMTRGPLSTSTAWQISSTTLDQQHLTRPNQKALTVLASRGFVTSLGTGRLSGDAVASNSFDVRNVGRQDSSAFPPTSGVSNRPAILHGSGLLASAQPDMVGMVENLPLGALFRDHDFLGGGSRPFETVSDVSSGIVFSNPIPSGLEVSEAFALPAVTSPGLAGEVLIAVDGEMGLYTVLTNYRVARGGSTFIGSGDRPGAGLAMSYQDLVGQLGDRVLVCRAYLVRNEPTYVGATQVSAGGELMLYVVTNVAELGPSNTAAAIAIATSGVGEGYAAADLYRINGHPLEYPGLVTDTDIPLL